MAKEEISTFWLFSVDEETGLCLALPEKPKTGFEAHHIVDIAFANIVCSDVKE